MKKTLLVLLLAVTAVLTVLAAVSCAGDGGNETDVSSAANEITSHFMPTVSGDVSVNGNELGSIIDNLEEPSDIPEDETC